MHLVLSNFVGSELFGRTSEMSCESLDNPDVRPCCILGVITALEFLQHHLSKSGHKDLLVTHTIHQPSPYRNAERPPRERVSSNAPACGHMAPVAPRISTE